jgi:chlorite dismutase
MKYIKVSVFISTATIVVINMMMTNSLMAQSNNNNVTAKPNKTEKNKSKPNNNSPIATPESNIEPGQSEQNINPSKNPVPELGGETVKTEKDAPFITYVSILLGIVNILGLGTAFFLLSKKSTENIINAQRKAENLKSEISRNIKSIEVDVNGQKQLIENRIKAVDKENQESIANLRRKVEDLQQTTARISQTLVSGSQPSRSTTRELSERNYSSSKPVNNQVSYINRYNDNRQNFQDSYQAITVEREVDNYKLSRSGKTEDVILEKQSQGNYLLFSDNGRSCIVPKHTFKMREDEINDVQNLFECINYREDNYSNFILVEPAVLTPQGDGTWQLKEKGKLQFG